MDLTIEAQVCCVDNEAAALLEERSVPISLFSNLSLFRFAQVIRMSRHSPLDGLVAKVSERSIEAAIGLNRTPHGFENTTNLTYTLTV